MVLERDRDDREEEEGDELRERDPQTESEGTRSANTLWIALTEELWSMCHKIGASISLRLP